MQLVGGSDSGIYEERIFHFSFFFKGRVNLRNMLGIGGMKFTLEVDY